MSAPPAPPPAARAGGQHHQPLPAGAGAAVVDVDPLASLALVQQALPGLLGRLAGSRDPGREVDRDDVPSLGQQRLVDRDEVAHRGLRGGRPLVASAQALVEARVLGSGDLDLGPLLALERDVEADPVDAVLGDQLVGQVGRRVGDDGRGHIGAHRPLLSRLYHPVARGQDPRHRRHRLPRLARGPRARRARRRAAAAAAPRIQPGPPFGSRDRARRRRRHRPAGGAKGDGGRRPRLPSGRDDVDAPGQPRRGLRAERQGHADRPRGGARRGGEAGRPHVVGRRDRPGESARDGRREPAVQRRPPRDRLRRTPSTRRRSRRCASPPTGSRW